MSLKKAMILDVGGVLVTNYSPQFWQSLAADYDLPIEALKQFRRDVRSVLWTGAIPETEFWVRMTGRFPGIDAADARARLISAIQPLPALARLAEWRGQASLNVLSNHRTEWIRPFLEQVLPFVDHVIVSAEAGSCKPDPEIFGRMNARLAGYSDRLYIDDSGINLPGGAALGWKTLLADEGGFWIAHAEAWLGE